MKSWHVKYARRVLENGGVIAYPTEAVMGLGCSPWNGAAVAKVLRLKRRSPDKGLIIVAADIEQLSAVVDFSQVPGLEQMTSSWPGPVTWLVPAWPATPRWLTGKHKTLAVRVSAHPVVRRLCDETGLLVSTSANPSGCHPARTLRRARAYFGQAVDCYLPGSVGPGHKPTTIRDALTGLSVRE